MRLFLRWSHIPLEVKYAPSKKRGIFLLSSTGVPVLE